MDQLQPPTDHNLSSLTINIKNIHTHNKCGIHLPSFLSLQVAPYAPSIPISFLKVYICTGITTS